MSAPLSEQQLAAIRDRLDHARDVAGRGDWPATEYAAVVQVFDTVPMLLAEVERLREELAREQRLYAAYRKGAAEAGRAMRAEITKARAAGLLDAAAIVDNGDDCDCGGCDTCIPRALARQIRDRAYSVARGEA